MMRTLTDKERTRIIEALTVATTAPIYPPGSVVAEKARDEAVALVADINDHTSIVLTTGAIASIEPTPPTTPPNPESEFSAQD